MSTKYIFVTGGVLSSLGKGIAAASLAAILKSCGLRVSMLKADPYINADPGSLSPLEHGEVFVTDDGTQSDLDLGHYERFLDEDLGHLNSFTTGKIYAKVLENEKLGLYKGATIQVIPHITGEITRRIREAAKGYDVLIVEIGGTVGDIESLPFLEAIRFLGDEEGRDNSLYLHLTLIPFIRVSGELKTKPTQHSVGELRRIGITPDFIICRSEEALGLNIKNKIAKSCGVRQNCVIESIDAQSIYELPLRFLEQDILSPLASCLKLELKTPKMHLWKELTSYVIAPEKRIKIALLVQRKELKECYKSLTEALIHAGAKLNLGIDLEWMSADEPLKEGILGLIALDDELKAWPKELLKAVQNEDFPVLGIGLAGFAAFGLDEGCVSLQKDVGACELAINGPLESIYKAKSLIRRQRRSGVISSSKLAANAMQAKICAFSTQSDIEALYLEGKRFYISICAHVELHSRFLRPEPLLLAFCEACKACDA